MTGARRGFALRAASATAPVRLWFDIGHGLVVTNSADVTVTGPIEIDYTSGAYYQGTVATVAAARRAPAPPADPARRGRCFRRARVDPARCALPSPF